MPVLVFLAFVLGAGLIGYRLGQRADSRARAQGARRGQPEIIVPARSWIDERREVSEAGQELGRWLESAGDARDEVSPATWDRIADASSRIATAAGRLATRTRGE